MSTSNPNLLFVYGSLLSKVREQFGGHNPELFELFSKKATYWGDTKLRGRLYLVEDTTTMFRYPGIELDHYANLIHAEVYNVTSRDLFDSLDEWEAATVTASGVQNYDGDKLYCRRVVTVMHDGKTHTGWVYEGLHHWTARRYIPHTSWEDYLQIETQRN